MTEPSRRRRLPLKVPYRGLELSAESEASLERAMAKLDTNNPNEALTTALHLLLKRKHVMTPTSPSLLNHAFPTRPYFRR